MTVDDQQKESEHVYRVPMESGKLSELLDSWGVQPDLRSIKIFLGAFGLIPMRSASRHLRV